LFAAYPICSRNDSELVGESKQKQSPGQKILGLALGPNASVGCTPFPSQCQHINPSSYPRDPVYPGRTAQPGASVMPLRSGRSLVRPCLVMLARDHYLLIMPHGSMIKIGISFIID
jgi:hypothetical protein